jgi:hypothetical protein
MRQERRWRWQWRTDGARRRGAVAGVSGRGLKTIERRGLR